MHDHSGLMMIKKEGQTLLDMWKIIKIRVQYLIKIFAEILLY